MTNGGDAHGRTGKKKPGSKKAKGKNPKTPIKPNGIVPESLASVKNR
jgi:hypothetical protein